MGILSMLGLGRDKMTLQGLWDVMAVLEEEVKVVKKKKEKWREDILKEKIVKFLLDLKEEGVIVQYEEGDGEGDAKKKKLLKMDLDRLFGVYTVGTINGIEKEIKRRESENAKTKRN